MRTALEELCVLEEVWMEPWGNLGGWWRGLERYGEPWRGFEFGGKFFELIEYLFVFLGTL
jgi:hypothetical protein